jgi:hypothetical protein
MAKGKGKGGALKTEAELQREAEERAALAAIAKEEAKVRGLARGEFLIASGPC